MDVCPFKVPDNEDRRLALGSLAGLFIRVRRPLEAYVPLF